MKCPACNGNVLKEKTENENVYSYLCLKCGFTASDNNTRKNNKKNDNSKLIEDLSFFESEDEDAKRWYPSVFVHERGMLYPEGENTISWNWVFVPIVMLTESELSGSEYIGYNKRLAVEQKKTYDKFEFLEALKNLGNINEELGV